MSIVITAVVFVLIFSVLVLIHEFGHFIMAKRAGIKVEEFGFGLPPRIWGKKKGETIYSINWIPFGGFVRMLGEDSKDAKSLKEKRSFAAASMRNRVKVIVAGVVMNFLLAWLLLTVGFTFGMQPLLGPDDILPAIEDGNIVLSEGVKIKNLEDKSFFQVLGMKNGDTIFEIDGKVVDQEILTKVADDPTGKYTVLRDGEALTFDATEEFVKANVSDDKGEQKLGVEFYDFAAFPRVKVFQVEPDSYVYKAGIRPNDILLSVNGNAIFDVENFEKLTRGQSNLEYEIYRNGVKEKFLVSVEGQRRVIISNVIKEMPAFLAGLKDGDVVLSINGKSFTDSIELIKFVDEHRDEKLGFMIERGGEQVFYEIKPQDGKIGVYLSELMSYFGDQHMSLYNVNLLSSVIEVKDEKYPLHVAAYKAVQESYRMSKLTANMFVGVILDLLKGEQIPETVSGPVGIAQLTHTFVQEGLISLIRFVAILSLSLAVINILPFPALDGGRLLFIIIEFVMGRRVNQKWESMIHGLGYLLILLLILAVTYNDIMKLF